MDLNGFTLYSEPMLKLYAYDGCDTCRKAIRYLEKRKVAFEKIPIVDQPPTPAELKRMLGHVGDLKRLLNTSGQVYREMRLSEKLPAMSEAEVLGLLARNGRLIKRPFALSTQAGKETGTVGFKESEWANFK